MCQILLLGAGLGRHRLDRFEFVTADEVHSREHPFELLAQPRFDFGLDPRQRPQRAGGDAREIVEKPVLALHPRNLIGSPVLTGLPPKYGAAPVPRESGEKNFFTSEAVCMPA